MSTLAIDRFRAKGLPPKLEAQAQYIASEFGSGRPEAALLLGYLQASVADALELPRWMNRDRLAVDLRVVEILWKRR